MVTVLMPRGIKRTLVKSEMGTRLSVWHVDNDVLLEMYDDEGWPVSMYLMRGDIVDLRDFLDEVLDASQEQQGRDPGFGEASA